MMEAALQASEPTASANGWLAADLKHDESWIVRLEEADRVQMMAALRETSVPSKPLLAYCKEDFAFGNSLEPVRRALDEAQHGRGAALVKGLPREGLSEEDFKLLSW